MDSLEFVEDKAFPGGKEEQKKGWELTGGLGSGARGKFASGRWGELGIDGRSVKTLKALGDPHRSTYVEVD